MSISTDVAAIAGKTFTSNYFYNVSASTLSGSSINGVGNYSGSAGGFSASSVSGQVDVVNAETGQITIGGTPYTVLGSSTSGQHLVFGTATKDPFFGDTVKTSLVLSNSGSTPTSNVNFSSSNAYATPNPACFVAGTMISTPTGETRVEELLTGDYVLTAEGSAVMVKWIGHRTVDCRTHPWPEKVLPVTIAVDALAPGVPKQPLQVSPNHSIAMTCLNEVLIPARLLVNGTTIIQEQVGVVKYVHVELDSHCLLLANGVPAESYLDTGNRGDFDGSHATTTLHPDFSSVERSEIHCRPQVFGGIVLHALREMLKLRAEHLGWTQKKLPSSSVSLLVDGKPIEASYGDGVAQFLIPGSASSIHILSNTFVPQHIWSESGDQRSLGVYVSKISVTDEFGCSRIVEASDARLSEGFHSPELSKTRVLRWTNGKARLPATLLSGLEGSCLLTLHYCAVAELEWVHVDEGLQSAAANALAA